MKSSFLVEKKPGSLFWDASTRKILHNHNNEYSSKNLIGHGKSFSSFGEIVQGRLSIGNDFLVTLPINLWSTCILTCKPIDGPLVIECDYEKSKSVLYRVLDEVGITSGYHIDCTFERNIPIGKGLSSSTADMLAALRALQEVFGLLISDKFISRIFTLIEPHDGVHYNSCVAYDHRKGVLISNYEHIPDFHICIVDNGGTVDTIVFNKNLKYISQDCLLYDALFDKLTNAFLGKKDKIIAECATKSAQLFYQRTGSSYVLEALNVYDEIGSIGVVVTHSGTCVGFIFDSYLSSERKKSISEYMVKKFKNEPIFVNTLHILS